MKCMHEDHEGSASRLIYVPRKKAEGHAKIRGPLICDICYFKEFKATDWLPSDVWVQPAGKNAPTLLTGHLSAAVPAKHITASQVGRGILYNALCIATAGIAAAVIVPMEERFSKKT